MSPRTKPTSRIRILPPEEFYKLNLIYQMNGGVPPKSSENIIAVCEAGDQIVGMVAINNISHIGPIWVDPDVREKGIATQLIKMLESKFTSGYYMFPSNEAARALCKGLGMVKMDWEVWKKEL